MEDLKMAGLTKEQREAKAKAKLEAEKAKELESQNVDVVEEVEEVVVKEKPQPKKATPKKLEEDDMVLVASYASGLTKLTNNDKPFDEYIWERFGEVQEVRYGTLEQKKRKNGNDLFTKFVYVLDEQAVKQLGLEKVYSELKPPAELEKIINMSLEHSIKFVEGANDNMRLALREILINKVQNKENINAFNLIALAEKLDIQLDTINLK
jgi:hypothetical protein